MKTPDLRPPAAARRLLKLLFTDQGLHTHLGDFQEAFEDIGRTRGRAAARAWYWAQVLKSSPGFLSNRLYWSIAMIRNYLLISYRNIRKNKWFSLINLAGLAVGLAGVIMIAAYVRFELSFDRFHEDAGRIYRVLGRAALEPDQLDPGVPEVLAPALASNIPEIAETARVYRFWRTAVLSSGEKSFLEEGTYADAGFLDLFSFPLLRGDRKTALSAPGSVVLGQDLAAKLFGDADPIGQPVSLKRGSRQTDLTVTGVLKRIPAPSHLQFRFLVSLETLRADAGNAYMFDTWRVRNFFTYVKLAEGSSRAEVEAKLPALISSYAKADPRKGLAMTLQPLTDIHLRSRINGGEETNDEIHYVILFASIALALLVIACVNYINLTTARSASRAKEIGIRQVTGASRRSLFRQFIAESVFMTIAALILALAIVRVFWPKFQALTGVGLEIGSILNPGFLSAAVLGALGVGILAGLYPAAVLSSMRPLGTLSQFRPQGRRGLKLRSALVIVQFSAAIFLALATSVIWRQMTYIKSQNLGYDREQVIVIPVREKETAGAAEAIQNDFLGRPEVLGVSRSSALPLQIGGLMSAVRFESETGSPTPMDIYFDSIDDRFLDLFRIGLIQGRNFSPGVGQNQQGVLLNETAVKALGWKNPLGKRIDGLLGRGRELRVAGVVKDFYFLSFHQTIQPLALLYEAGSQIIVRIKPGDLPRTLSVLREAFERRTKGQPFDYFFLDDAFNDLYRRETRMERIFRVFAGLTIFIACLGVAGLTAYAVEKRTKEVGIRKVMGASWSRLMVLLNRRLIGLVLASAAIAFPLAQYAMGRWLKNFVYKVGLPAGMYLIVLAGALAVALLTTGWQTARVARKKPTESLRYE